MPVETLRVTEERNFKRSCEHGMNQPYDLDAKLEEVLQRDFGILEHHRLEDDQTGRQCDIYIIGRNEQEANVVVKFQEIGIEDPDPNWTSKFTVVAPEEVLRELTSVSV